MSGMPVEGEALRKAVKRVSEMRAADPAAPLSDLVEKASIKFDLSPKDECFLLNFFIEGKDKIIADEE